MRQRLHIVLLAALVLSAAGCKSEKKIESYSDIYSEKPTTIYLAPINDKAERRVEKYPTDVAYNNELNSAKAYLYQTLSRPLLRKGYYVIGAVTSAEIASQTNLSAKQLRNGDLSVYQKDYGIDAVLVVTIHRWTDGNGTKTALMEYVLRSTKTNHELMHTWVMATKEVSKNLKNDPISLKNDKKFMKRFDMDNGSAQRCFLVEKVNDYVLRNLPTSSSRRQFKGDQYELSNPTYIKYSWIDGGADVQPCSVEEYESAAFL
ncbi:MAG: hypothetical protein IJM88_07590 [Bacteroidales bacterium]|nr:hypothetical protein [Bacteroidales bacterium]